MSVCDAFHGRQSQTVAFCREATLALDGGQVRACSRDFFYPFSVPMFGSRQFFEGVRIPMRAWSVFPNAIFARYDIDPFLQVRFSIWAMLDTLIC